MDAALSAIVGTSLGAIIALLGNILTAFIESKRSARAFRQQYVEKKIELTKELYEEGIVILLDVATKGKPTKKTDDELTLHLARMRLTSPESVNEPFKDVVMGSKSVKIGDVIEKMQKHIRSLEQELIP